MNLVDFSKYRNTFAIRIEIHLRYVSYQVGILYRPTTNLQSIIFNGLVCRSLFLWFLLVKKVEVCFLCSAVSSPLDNSKRVTLHLRQTCSFRHQLDFYGKHSSHATITHEDYSLIFTPPSVTKYLFEQLSELKMLKFRNGIRIRALSIASPAFYHRAIALHIK